MTYAKLADGSGVRGTHHVPSTAHVYYVKNNGNPNSTGGQLARILVTPAEKVAEGNRQLTPFQTADFDDGVQDLSWDGSVIDSWDMGIYKYPQAPAHGLAGIDPSSLSGLSYPFGPIPEDGQDDNYYAGKTVSDYYVVFRIYKVQNDGTTRIEWITFNTNTSEVAVGSNYRDPRDVVLSPDLKTAYVSARDATNRMRILAVPNTGDSLVPKFTPPSNPAGLAIDVVSAPPLVEIQQIAIDPGNHQIIYVVDSTGLWRIVSKQTVTKVVSIPNGGMGLLIDDNRIAIVSDIQGNLFQVDLNSSNPTLEPLNLALLGRSGFLTWVNESKTSFFATVRDPHKVMRVDLQTREAMELADLPSLSSLTNAWSVEPLSPTRIFIATESEVGTLDLYIPSNALVLGIGHVPFDYIIQDPNSQHRGKADTTTAPGYFYKANKVPFGRDLRLMINHPKAHNAGLRYFRVTLKKIGAPAGRVITESFTDLLWKSVGGAPKFESTPVSSTGATPSVGIPANAYPIRSPNELWYHAYLGMIMKTRRTEGVEPRVDNGLHEVKVEFFDQNGQLVVGETKTYVLLLDNNICIAKLELPRIGNPPPSAYPTLDCGCITYTSKDDKVALDFIASQANGEATYSLIFARGSAALPMLEDTKLASPSVTPLTKTSTKIASSPTFKVGHLLGNCNVASILVSLRVPSRAIDGFGAVEIYQAKAELRFSLVPSNVTMSTPWQDPGG